MSSKRNVGLDLLKILAVSLVLILHINSFYIEGLGGTIDNVFLNYVWHFLEACAYPAIHLFVLVSCYFWTEKGTSIKNGINVWLQTASVCVIGLAFAVMWFVPFYKIELLSTLFPFSGRAYWFVSDYILLLLVAPFLKCIIDKTNCKQLQIIICSLFVFISVYCFFLTPFHWDQDYSNIALFILLFFIAAFVRRNMNACSLKLGG